MDVLWSFLRGIIEKGFYFWRVIQPNQAGVRTFCGLFPSTLKQGLHFVCPVLGDITVMDIKDQVKDVRSQTLTTADGVSVAVGLSVRYDILDIYRAIYEVHDFDESLSNECVGILDDYVSQHTFAECCNPAEMCGYAVNELRKVVTARWGLRILRVRRSDFGRCPAVRMMGFDGLRVLVDSSIYREGE